MSERVWTTQDGKQIPIKKLEDKHLMNVVRYVIRRVRASKWRDELELLSAESVLNGDGALMCIERAQMELNEMSLLEYILGSGKEVSSLWKALTSELKRRKLRVKEAEEISWRS